MFPIMALLGLLMAAPAAMAADDTISPLSTGDADLDGILDEVDNCVTKANADQRDTNGDGYGNICDPDFNQNGVVDSSDLSLLKSRLRQPATTAPDQDLNGNGVVDSTDYSIAKAYLRQPPGPSCVDRAGGCLGTSPVARGDTYATPAGKTLTVQLSRVSGVLYNDFDISISGENVGNAGLTAILLSGPTAGTLNYFNADGSFEYVPGASLGDNQNDSFTYQTQDTDGNLSEVATVNIHILSNQPDFKIMMNYELGMHCTGFEFSYCCVLPPYNSILAQVVKPQNPGAPTSNADFPRLLEGDPNNGLDGLGRETVLRDYDGSGNFQKYYVEYFHDAQPRREGNMPFTFNDQTSTLISNVEGNSLLYHNTPYDSALVDTDGSITGVPGKLVTGTYAGANYNVVVGNGSYMDATDNFANGWLNHFYIYADLEGTIPGQCTAPPANALKSCTTNSACDSTAGAGDGVCDTSIQTSLERNKIRLGVNGMVEYPANTGAALQPMGPTGNGTPFDNVLTFSGDTGTVVYTQMKVLENLPIMLTSPNIWEALGLPLTPFEDSINFFGAPGSVDEDSVRPYVAMKARLHTATCNDTTGACTKGPAVIASNGQPVMGFGTAPIDIPNCERCHSSPAYQPDGVTPNVNSPNYVRRQLGPDPYFGPFGVSLQALTDLEADYWKSIYPSLLTGSDWYARLKAAAINMLAMHDYDNGTTFTANYPQTSDTLGLPPSKQIPQNTRMGFESVICQKCHADNVIAVVKSTNQGSVNGPLIPPISEAIHNTHRNQSEGGVIVFNDALGRSGGCQGCHPAHRSDGAMDKYPISYAGNNANADGDNRLNQGGCFVGRDVHSNPLKNVDGAETPEHLNAVGQWLQDNVSTNQAGLPGSPEADYRGIWCTNCHTQLSQEIWRTEDCNDLINNDCLVNPRGEPTLAAVATAVGLTEQQAIDYLDPKVNGFDRSTDQTHAIWNPSIPDANVATIEVAVPGSGASCAPLTPVFNATFGVDVCVSLDGDGDPSVNILSFCTTQDCVDRINNNPSDQTQWRYPANAFAGTGTVAAAVPFSAADDARDHWLSPGEPHCADCHAAPYTEQSGNISAYPPFNYPAKASLMRYTRGHQDISCQGCHESIHGLYPVSSAVDNTTYAQAAALNSDGSHGPLKCGACHDVASQANQIPTWIVGGGLVGSQIGGDFDNAVTWAHTYTDEASVLNSTCQNCHGVNGQFGGGFDPNSTPAQWTNLTAAANCATPGTCEAYMGHSMRGNTSRAMMDKAETAVLGDVIGATNPAGTACAGCHVSFNPSSCSPVWRQHLTQGRVAESVWEDVSNAALGNTCGW